MARRMRSCGETGDLEKALDLISLNIYVVHEGGRQMSWPGWIV